MTAGTQYLITANQIEMTLNLMTAGTQYLITANQIEMTLNL